MGVGLFVLLGWISQTALVESWLADFESSPVGPWAIGLVVFLAGLNMLLLWVAALWYVRTSPDVIVPRPLAMGALILTNFAGAFFYYWFAVHWRARTRAIRKEVAPLSAP
jgi:hypothetical protein